MNVNDEMDDPQDDETAIRRQAAREALQKAYGFYRAYWAALYDLKSAAGADEWSTGTWATVESFIGELYDEGATVDDSKADELLRRLGPNASDEHAQPYLR